MTKFYVDGQGAYIGGFDGALPPDGAIEVSKAPNTARDKWIGGAWQVVQTDEEHDAEIDAQLAKIDLQSIRHLRVNDVAKLAALEAKAATLRGKYKTPRP